MSSIDLPTRIAKTRRALTRYRVMAWITGVFLLVLCVEMIFKYVIKVDDAIMANFTWIPYAHGWIYVVYLVTVIDLWSKMRWKFGRLAAMVFAGVVPVLSFRVEKKVHAEASALLDGAAVAAGAQD